jgi:hypothetical protein
LQLFHKYILGTVQKCYQFSCEQHIVYKDCWVAWYISHVNFCVFCLKGSFYCRCTVNSYCYFLQNVWCDCSVLSLQLTKASDVRKLCILLCVCVCVCARARACVCGIPVLYGVSVLNRNSSYMCWCFGTGSEHAVLFHRKWLWSWNQRELDIHSYCMKANCTRSYMVVLEFHISGGIFVIYLLFYHHNWYVLSIDCETTTIYICTLKVFLIVEINVAWEMIRWLGDHILWDMVWLGVLCCLQITVHCL